MNWLNRLRTRRILKRHPIADHDWRDAVERLPLLATLTSAERVRLRVLTTLFLHRKSFTGVQGIELTPSMKLVIAAQACIEVLNLDLALFDGWKEITVYPGAFRVERDVEDELGLVHRERRTLSGESWGRGPVILSWDDVEQDSFRLRPGRNVVIHEFAHKLDMLNGRANGMPPLHPDMPIEAWTRSLSDAYERLVERVAHHHNHINAYAATDPAEFFAVICEYFFTAPALLRAIYPEVFLQLKRYFRQDPGPRMEPMEGSLQPGIRKGFTER